MEREREGCGALLGGHCGYSGLLDNRNWLSVQHIVLLKTELIATDSMLNT
jgi:hypothetical protein